MVYGDITYTSPPLLNRDELVSEWKFFRRVFHKEKSSNVHLVRHTDGYANWDSNCRESFSQMKLTKTRLRNRLSDINLCRLMRIAVEGPELNEVNFEEIVDFFITGT